MQLQRRYRKRKLEKDRYLNIFIKKRERIWRSRNMQKKLEIVREVEEKTEIK